jgi:EREBP-like factor
MEGECYTSPSASSSTPTISSIGKRKHGRQQNQEKPYRGIRMRKWGKWVAEIREPH